jgi:hypothetical protein
MTPPIERVRYYDGEYLRAFDFTADQAYHVDMRRRLNMSLHLYGIVEGLQLQDTSDASTGISQVSIISGMAIERFGREIFLLAPYTFDDVADVNANKITVSQIYEVWIQYLRVPETPPSVGYAACDTTAQNTRWLETFKIVLLSTATPTNPPAPQVTDDISEDETPDPDTSNGVYLGKVFVAPGSTTGVFSLNDASGNPISQPHLSYIGLRAQNIQAPDYPDTTSPAFDILNPNSPLTPPLGVEVQSNLFCDQNLIVGQDFAVSPPPNPAPPAPFPEPTGNLKVASDLFLQGNLYSEVSGAWLNIAQQVAALLPDVLVGIVEVTPSPPLGQAPAPFKFTVSSSHLKAIGRVTATAAIASLQWNTKAILQLNLVDASQILAQIISVAAQPNPTINNACDVTVTWTVGPTFSNAITPASAPLPAVPATFESAIVDLWISYVVVCYPP